MSTSIRNLSSQIRAAYDNAVFSGRMQRMVINIKTGEFLVEQAPLNFNGRPPLFNDHTNTLNESHKKTLLNTFEEKAKNESNRPSPYSQQDNPIYYSIRSIPVVRKNILTPIKWFEVNDSTISRQSLIGNVTFAQFKSGLSTEVYDYSTVANSSDSKQNTYGYIYFLPDGTTTPTSIQLAIKDKDNMISEDSPKYTLNLNTLTGQSYLLEGFQDANFTLPKK